VLSAETRLSHDLQHGIFGPYSVIPPYRLAFVRYNYTDKLKSNFAHSLMNITPHPANMLLTWEKPATVHFFSFEVSSKIHYLSFSYII